MDLILGSQSPRRRELLERMGLSFRVLTAEIDETKFETEDPEASVRRICEAKARAVARVVGSDPLIAPVIASGNDAAAARRQEASGDASLRKGADVKRCLILTSDTIVVLDGRILGKPHGEDEARAMLAALSGREHAVYTAFTLLPVEATGDGGYEATGNRQQATGDGGYEAAGNRQQATGDGGREGTGNRQQAIGDGGYEATGNRQQATGDGGTDCRDQSADWSRNDKLGGASRSDDRHLSPVTCHLSPVTCHLPPFTHCEKTFVKFRALSAEEIAAYVATGEPMDKAGAYGIQGLGAMLVEGIRGDYFTVMGLPVCQLAQALKRYGIDPLTQNLKP